MRVREIIAEVPQIIPPTEFGLDEPNKNRAMRAAFLTGSPEVLIDEPGFQVLLVGYAGSGKIGLIEKKDGWLAYFVEYELVDTFVGRSVTQVTLWRDNTSVFVKGITTRMFRDVLLARFKSVMSDGQQTRDGQRFWISCMAESAAAGLKVGLADLGSQSIDWLAPGADFRAWISAANGWGQGPEFQAKRFVISTE